MRQRPSTSVVPAPRIRFAVRRRENVHAPDTDAVGGLANDTRHCRCLRKNDHRVDAEALPRPQRRVPPRDEVLSRLDREGNGGDTREPGDTFRIRGSVEGTSRPLRLLDADLGSGHRRNPFRDARHDADGDLADGRRLAAWRAHEAKRQ